MLHTGSTLSLIHILVNDGRKVMMQAGLRYQLLYPTLILSLSLIHICNISQSASGVLC